MKKAVKSGYKKLPIINGLYQHYKGGMYKVMSIARHTTTEEELVIYKSIHYGSNHARPLSEWFNEVKNHDGHMVGRFEIIKNRQYYDMLNL